MKNDDPIHAYMELIQIYCYFTEQNEVEKLKVVKSGDEVTIKGRFDGSGGVGFTMRKCIITDYTEKETRNELTR